MVTEKKQNNGLLAYAVHYLPVHLWQRYMDKTIRSERVRPRRTCQDGPIYLKDEMPFQAEIFHPEGENLP